MPSKAKSAHSTLPSHEPTEGGVDSAARLCFEEWELLLNQRK
jgi:hypothetical protein